MSRPAQQTIAHVAQALEMLARDLKRPRPACQTPEASDARISAQLAQLAAMLRKIQS